MSLCAFFCLKVCHQASPSPSLAMHPRKGGPTHPATLTATWAFSFLDVRRNPGSCQSWFSGPAFSAFLRTQCFDHLRGFLSTCSSISFPVSYCLSPSCVTFCLPQPHPSHCPHSPTLQMAHYYGLDLFIDPAVVCSALVTWLLPPQR